MFSYTKVVVLFELEMNKSKVMYNLQPSRGKFVNCFTIGIEGFPMLKSGNKGARRINLHFWAKF